MTGNINLVETSTTRFINHRSGLRHFLYYLSICLLLQAPGAISADYSQGVIKGKITDKSSNKPLSGVVVTAYDSDSGKSDERIGRTTTDKKGNYTIRIPKRDRDNQWDGAKTDDHVQWRPDIFILAKKDSYKRYKSKLHADHALKKNLRIDGKMVPRSPSKLSAPPVASSSKSLDSQPSITTSISNTAPDQTDQQQGSVNETATGAGRSSGSVTRTFSTPPGTATRPAATVSQPLPRQAATTEAIQRPSSQDIVRMASRPSSRQTTNIDDFKYADDDLDGVNDYFEDRIAITYAPLVRLPPIEKDWTRPANVDWYLDRVQLRFENTGTCFKDDLILGVGKVNQGNLSLQSKRDKKLTVQGCKNEGTRYYSNKSKRFFLQPPNDNVHKGSAAPEWAVYAHIVKSNREPGGYEIQYWFFYAYNDSVASFNHEGDWERITIVVDQAGGFVRANFGQHNYSTNYRRDQLNFVQGTQHPIVYSADGSHASYPRAGSFDIKGAPAKDNTYNGGPEWKTWKRLINVGEKEHPRNGQTFIQYAGRWGEIGQTQHTSGPVSPSFQGGWTPAAASSPPSSPAPTGAHQPLRHVK